MHVLVSQLKDVANKRKKTTKPLESERFNLEPLNDKYSFSCFFLSRQILSLYSWDFLVSKFFLAKFSGSKN